MLLLPVLYYGLQTMYMVIILLVSLLVLHRLCLPADGDSVLT